MVFYLTTNKEDSMLVCFTPVYEIKFVHFIRKIIKNFDMI